MWEAATICHAPCKLTMKVVSGSGMVWATFVPILVFLGPSVVDLGPIYATERQTDVRQTDVRRASSLSAPGPRGGDIITAQVSRLNHWTAAAVISGRKLVENRVALL